MRTEQEQFEDKAFNERFIKGIKKKGTGQFDWNIDCPMMEDFIAKDEKGNYKDLYLDAMWFGWQMAKGLIK